MLANHGVRHPLQRKDILAAQQIKMKQTTLERYGVENVFDSAELQKGYVKKAKDSVLKKYGVANVGMIPGIQEKIRMKCQTPLNNTERILLDLLPPSAKYVGDGKHWIRTKMGPRNPDFIISPFSESKCVIELFGAIGYWHTDEEANNLIAAYSELGVHSLIVTDTCIYSARRRAITKELVNQFFESFGSSETSPKGLYINQDKVQSLLNSKV